MRYLGFLFTFLVCSTAFADLYVGEKQDGSVSQLNYIQGSSDSLSQVEREQGFVSGSLVRVDAKTLPQEEIKYWKLVGGEIVVDHAKKESDNDSKRAEKEARSQAKQAVLAKLKITKAELKTLLEAE